MNILYFDRRTKDDCFRATVDFRKDELRVKYKFDSEFSSIIKERVEELNNFIVPLLKKEHIKNNTEKALVLRASVYSDVYTFKNRSEYNEYTCNLDVPNYKIIKE